MSRFAGGVALSRTGRAVAAGLLLLATFAVSERPTRAENKDIGALGSNQFAPNDVSAVVGDQVTFTNGGGTHSAVAVGGAYPAIPLAGGQSGSWQLSAPGTVWYYCGVHANAAQANEQGLAAGAMVGRIVVSQPAPTATPVPPTAIPSPTATLSAPSATAAIASPTGTQTATPTGTLTRTPTRPGSATGTPTAATTTPLPPDASDEPDDDGGSNGPLMGFVAGGLALAAVGGGVFLALRLRRAT